MSKIEKLIIRFNSIPNDFTWDELVTILRHYGFEELQTGKTGGSRRRFMNADLRMIHLHKPHPSNIVKRYMIRYVIDTISNKKRFIWTTH